MGERGVPWMGRGLSMWRRVEEVWSLVRLRPFDVGTPVGRSRERYRRVLLSGIATGLARGVTLLTLAIAVPLLLSHFGAERYGLWASINALTALLSFSDLGLGSGLMNAIARAHAAGDRQAASLNVSSAFFLLAAIALVLVASFLALFPHIEWDRVFNVTSSIAAREAGPAAFVFVLCLLVSMPLGIVQRIHAGYQESFVGTAWQTLGSVVGLAGLLLAVHLGAGVPWVILAFAGSPVAAAAANSIWLFGWGRPWISPRLSRLRLAASRQLLHTGLLFFVIQVCAAFSYQSAALIIAHVLGAQRVAEYSVPMTLFQLSPWALSLVITPLWPAYAEAFTRGENAWIEKSFRRSIRVALMLNVPTAILLFFLGERIVGVWTQNAVQPDPFLLGCMSVWTILSSFNTPLAILYNSLSIIRFQVICATLMTVANLVLAIVLTARIGVAGAVVAMVVAQAVFVLLPSLVFVPKLLARMRQTASTAF